MRDVLILTGNAGVGKTTIGKAWAEARGGAWVQADEIRCWIRSQPLRRAARYQEVLAARLCLAAAEAFIEMGLDVGLDNVWTPVGIRLLREGLPADARVRSAWLWCEPAENHRRDDARACWHMGQRIDELEAELAAFDWPNDLVRIDSTHLSQAEVVALIEGLFGR